jgi:ATP-binding cassette subfamily B protein
MYAEKETVLSGRVVDSVSNAFTVRVFARRLYEIKYIQKALAVLNKVFKSKESFLLRLHIFQGLSLTAMLGFMLWALLSLRLKGLVSVGDFALILGVSIEVGYMTWWGLEQVDELNKSVGKCQQSLKVLFAPHKVEDKPSSSALIVKKGQITFDSVDFNYASSSLLFSNLSITIAAHSKVGLVGYSGGGKSTFVNLILRLYDIQKGEILIDGQNIREVTQDSLRASIGLIPQESTLFHRSLLENLRYAQPNATMEEVIKAAKQAQAHEFIMKLPHGYQSLVGERGTKLSGGQRQRVAIARAILKDAPILILDEATSQLDSVTEIELQKALRNLMKHKTTLVIAHRLSTLGQMDRILVFEHGRIVQDGSHAQLVREEGLYKRLWEAQVEGILPEVPSPSSA